MTAADDTLRVKEDELVTRADDRSFSRSKERGIILQYIVNRDHPNIPSEKHLGAFKDPLIKYLIASNRRRGGFHLGFSNLIGKGETFQRV